MTIDNAYMILALLVLLAIAALLVMGNRFKKRKSLSPLAALSFALIVAGIFFGSSRALGYSLLGLGIVLAFSDILIKVRRAGRSGKT